MSVRSSKSFVLGHRLSDTANYFSRISLNFGLDMTGKAAVKENTTLYTEKSRRANRSNFPRASIPSSTASNRSGELKHQSR
jgi:hypothetical protein